MKNFRTYEISKEFYHMIEGVEWPPHLRDQKLRAAELFYVMATLSAEKLAEKKFGKRCVAAGRKQASKTSETVSEVETVKRSAAPARASDTQVISVG